MKKIKLLLLTLVLGSLLVGCSNSNQTSISKEDLKNAISQMSDSEKEELKDILNNKTETKTEKTKETKTESVKKESTNKSNNKSKVVTKKYKYKCDLCGKGIPYSYIDGDAMMCKSCAAKQTCYLTDKGYNGKVGNSYECKTCGRYFSTSKERNLCTHGVCRGCHNADRDDTMWMKGEGFYCTGCGSRMAIYEDKMSHKYCAECGSTKNLVERKHCWLCKDCYEKESVSY